MTDADTPRLTANERRALAEFTKPQIDWSKVHGNTRDALRRKKLLDGIVITPAGRAALAVPDIFDDLFEEKPSVPKKKPEESTDAFRPIAHVETTLHAAAHDDSWVGGVRLYCTASPLTHGNEHARWDLQVRARVRTKRGSAGKQFAVGSASMSRKDLQWLRNQIDKALRRKV